MVASVIGAHICHRHVRSQNAKLCAIKHTDNTSEEGGEAFSNLFIK